MTGGGRDVVIVVLFVCYVSSTWPCAVDELSLSLSRARAGDGPRAQLAITQRTSLLTLTYDVSISRTH